MYTSAAAVIKVCPVSYTIGSLVVDICCLPFLYSSDKVLFDTMFKGSLHVFPSILVVIDAPERFH